MTLDTEDRRIIEQGLESTCIGEPFTIPELFGPNWDERTNTEKRSIGKAFRESVRKGEFNHVLFIRIGTRDRAVYRRIRNRP